MAPAGGESIVGFIPVVPDFAIELRSATDNLKPLPDKMREYQQLEVRLGLLINPKNKPLGATHVNAIASASGNLQIGTRATTIRISH
jgi:Uma2 family endonuclease